MTLAVRVQLKPGVKGLVAFDAQILSGVALAFRPWGGRLVGDKFPGGSGVSL